MSMKDSLAAKLDEYFLEKWRPCQYSLRLISSEVMHDLCTGAIPLTCHTGWQFPEYLRRRSLHNQKTDSPPVAMM
jgi:hypothetical protein